MGIWNLDTDVLYVHTETKSIRAEWDTMCLAAVTNSLDLICNFNNVCVQQYFNVFMYVPGTTKVQCKKISQNKLIKVQQESKMSLFLLE